MALINLRNALMTGTRLPYDAEVEYLESTGTQWIDTGIVPSFNTRIEATVQALATPTIVSTGATSYGVIGITYWNSPLSWATKFGNVGYKPAQGVASISTSAIYQLSLDKSNFTVNGTDYPINATSLSTSSSLRILYDIWNAGLDARVYNLKIYESATLVRDLIPVRKGTVGYLYDRVTGKLFGNAGTGDFVLGPDVVPVEWLASHWSEYIDTAVTPNNNTKVEIKFRTVNFSTYAAVAGVYGGTSDKCFYPATFLRLNDGQMKSTIGSENTAITFSAPVGTDIDLVFNDNHKLYVNGSLAGTFTETMGVQTKSLWLYAPNGYSTYKCSCKIYYAKVYDNSIPVRSYYPVRIGTDATSWEGAMMDTLTRRIYRNQGTGAFTYGNDLKYPIPA